MFLDQQSARREFMRRTMGQWFSILLAALILGSFGRGAAHGASGIKVVNDVILAMCTSCHANDHGIVSRISFLRKTPEGWEETLWRHKRIHGLKVSREQKEALLLYLSDRHGLAPAEVAPFAYTLEKRDTREKVEGQAVIDICVRCHSYAKAALQRRTPEEWSKLANMHSGVLPWWLYQLQDVLDWDETLAAAVKELGKRFPLNTAEWERWSGARPKTGDGKWVVAGYQAGKGAYTGEIEMKKTGDFAYAYSGNVEFEGGEQQPIAGKATLYGGYAWRAAGTLGGKPIREVFHVSADGSTFTGARFEDPHFELRGMETRTFAGGSAKILSVVPKALQAGTKDAKLTIVGTNLSKPGTEGVGFGNGVVVRKVVSASPTKVVVSVDVDDKAPTGSRTTKVGRDEVKGLFGVYASIDYIKVAPSPAMSRTGGRGLAVKQMVQFDAMAYSNGADGISGNEDDIEIGRVPADWKVVELMNAPDDDDIDYVGAIDRNGLFTPAEDGPNPKRRLQNNNVGDVWVTATYTPAGGSALSARGYLLATIPLMVQRPVQ
jgi:quinohemoprotein amine dehydrogenase